jgi:hypothetical protein
MKDLYFRSYAGEALGGWSRWLPAPCAWWGKLTEGDRIMLEEGELVGFGRLQLGYMTDLEVEWANGEVMVERSAAVNFN